MPSSGLSRRDVLRTAVLGATGSLAGCLGFEFGSDPTPIPDATPGPDDWPTSGYDARNTRYNAGASPPRTTPDPRWTRNFRFCHEPVVRGEHVVLNADERTVGVRARDGHPLWRSTSEPWGFETPTLGAERAYVTGVDCAFGVDLADGRETWRGRPCHGANTASGTIADGRLYLEYGGYFSALDATGDVTWATARDARGSPAVADETGYVATAFSVAAVDLTTDPREWPWEDSDDDEPAHSSRDAVTEWAVPPEPRVTGPRFYRSPAVTDDTVYATAERENRPGGELRALARSDGEERWRIASPPRSPSDRGAAPDPVGRPAAPVVTGDLVATSLGDRRVRALDHDGDVRWTADSPAHVVDLVGAGDRLVAVTHDRSVERTGVGHARITAFDIGTGERRWQVGFDDHVAGLAAAGETLYATRVTERDADGDVVSERLTALG
jgi:outer membrane protein assembly factor BamB